jgi:hypothetical protein
MITLETTAISQATAITSPATSSRPRVARNQQVVDRHRREEQQIDDGMAE